MTVVVVSQPMFLPWVGLFEQLRLADVFVHYDDVQLPLGRSFSTRVQIKTAQGSRWLTAPVKRRAGQRIDEARFANETFRARHLASLRHAYARAPHAERMLALAERIYAQTTDRLGEFTIGAFELIAAELDLERPFHRSSELDVGGTSSERLIGLVERLDGDRYLTGHGARNYLDHERFAARGIEVRYIDYARRPYPQLHGAFDPHVSILDAIANLGPGAAEIVVSGSRPWREFLAA